MNIQNFVFRDRTFVKMDAGEPNVVFIFNIQPEDRRDIVAKYKIDKHTLESALDDEEVSRIEVEDSKNYHVLWKTPGHIGDIKQGKFRVSSLGIIVQNGTLFLVSKHENEFLKKGMHENFTSVWDLIVMFLNDSTETFLEHLKIIRNIGKTVQAKINGSLANQYLLQMFDLSETLVYYQSALSANTIVLQKIKSFVEKHGDQDRLVDLLDNIRIESMQGDTQAGIYSQVFSGLMDARGSLVNNNMNVLMKKLTVINTIFLPLTLISGVFGMSEFTLMTQHMSLGLAYGLFFLAMVVIGGLTYLLITKLNYLAKG